MATAVVMPRQGQSVETCIITTWLKKKGDKVTTGDILFSYETDKAAFDMEAPADGILLDIFYSEGAEVPVLTNVAVIGSQGEETESFRPSGAAVAAEQPVKVATKPVIEEQVPVHGETHVKSDGKIKISPRARAMAKGKGINLSVLAGSGPGGRIVAADVENATAGVTKPAEKKVAPPAASSLPAGAYSDQPLSNVRRIISKAMHSSLQNSAQLTHHMSADVRKLLAARKKVKEDLLTGRSKADITLNDMVCFSVINALQKYPEMNSHFLDDKIRTFGNVNLGLAVDTPRGLMVPAVLNAEKMDIISLSSSLRSAAESCKKGNIDPELLKSTAASFTVSNLGNYGVEMFTPVINLPQAGILGVCTITHRPADLGDGTFGFVPVMGLSLTYDHRAVDGGPATLFLREIKTLIENFEI